MSQRLINISARHNAEVNLLKQEIINYIQQVRRYYYDIISNIEIEWCDGFGVLKLKIAPPFNTVQEEIDAVINVDESEIKIAAKVPSWIEIIKPSVEPAIREEIKKVLKKVESKKKK